MNEFVLNGLVKRRASVTRAPKPRKINEQKTGLPEPVWAPRIFVIPATLLLSLSRLIRTRTMRLCTNGGEELARKLLRRSRKCPGGRRLRHRG